MQNHLLSLNRSLIAKRNIIYSFFVKGFGILTSLLLIPLTINYLNPTEYGIWLTLNSILLWINTFDLGLGTGLRNRLTESLADEDYEKSKYFISTAYCIISLIVLILFLIFNIVFNFVDWYKLLNISIITVPNLGKVIYLTFGIFCLNFVAKLIGNILLAMQKAAVESLLNMLGQFLALVVIFIDSYFSKGTLLSVALIYSICPVLVYLFSYPFVFRGPYKAISPNIKYFRKDYIKGIMEIGLQFFVVQLAALVIFSTSNLIISNQFGPKMVTEYNIASRYFHVIPLLFTIVLTPLWSATTDAYRKGDMHWIKSSMKKINALIGVTFIVLILMVIVSDYVYDIWVGNQVNISNILSILIAIYVFVLICSLSYSSFLNGLGKLRVQMINIVFCSLFFFPLNFILIDKVGIYGVIISLTLVNLSGLILNIIQYNLLIKEKAKGIWNK